jgi:hypothetical protein
MEYILLANAAMVLLEKLLPIIGEKFKAGEIPIEEQAAVLARYESLKNRANGEFAGAHWKIEPDPQPATATDVEPAPSRTT